VSHWGDDIGEMPTQRLLDDASVEALLEGRLVPAELDALASAVGVLRETARRPVPPSQELIEFMATVGSGVRPERAARWHSGSSRLASLSLRIKLAVGFAAGLTGLTGAAAAAGELPPEVQAGVETAVETAGVGVAVETAVDGVGAAVEGVGVAVEIAVNGAGAAVAIAVDGVEAAVEFVTPIEFPEERVISKGNADPAGKPVLDEPAAPTMGPPPPYALDAAVPPDVAAPLPSVAPIPAESPDPQPEAPPTLESTPDPTPAPAPTPTPTPTEPPPPPPVETPTEPPPPDPVPPAESQAASSGQVPDLVPPSDPAAGPSADAPTSTP
jgi:hypothetical protein